MFLVRVPTKYRLEGNCWDHKGKHLSSRNNVPKRSPISWPFKCSTPKKLSQCLRIQQIPFILSTIQYAKFMVSFRHLPNWWETKSSMENFPVCWTLKLPILWLTRKASYIKNFIWEWKQIFMSSHSQLKIFQLKK